MGAGVIAVASALVFLPARASNPVPDSKCASKCESDYEDEAVRCAKIEAEDARKKCDTDAYDRYTTCRKNCQKQSDDKEKCKQRCEKYYEKCMDGCKDSDCRNKCFKDFQECLMDCEKG